MANIRVKESEDATVSVLLRIPSDLLAQMDSIRGKSLIKKNRTAWVLEAIFEKVMRENHGSRVSAAGAALTIYHRLLVICYFALWRITADATQYYFIQFSAAKPEPGLRI